MKAAREKRKLRSATRNTEDLKTSITNSTLQNPPTNNVPTPHEPPANDVPMPQKPSANDVRTPQKPHANGVSPPQNTIATGVTSSQPKSRKLSSPVVHVAAQTEVFELEKKFVIEGKSIVVTSANEQLLMVRKKFPISSALLNKVLVTKFFPKL